MLASVGTAEDEAREVLKAVLRSLGFVLIVLEPLRGFNWVLPAEGVGARFFTCKEIRLRRHHRATGSWSQLGMISHGLTGTASSVTTLDGSLQCQPSSPGEARKPGWGEV